MNFKERFLWFSIFSKLFLLIFCPLPSSEPKTLLYFKMPYSSRYSCGRRAVVKPSPATFGILFIILMCMKLFHKKSPYIEKKNTMKIICTFFPTHLRGQSGVKILSGN